MARALGPKSASFMAEPVSAIDRWIRGRKQSFRWSAESLTCRRQHRIARWCEVRPRLGNGMVWPEPLRLRFFVFTFGTFLYSSTKPLRFLSIRYAAAALGDR